MKFTRTRQTDTLRRDLSRFGRESRTLLRSRTVQSLLLATAAVQTVAVAGGKPRPVTAETVKPAAIVQRAARIAQPAAPRLAAATDTASAADKRGSAAAEKLAARYRAKGYRVSDKLAGQIVDAAGEHGISADVAFGLVATESGFKRTARSSVGAVGLAQLMPATARWLEPGTTRTDLEDPETNLRLGLRYLRDLVEKYEGDTALALTAYNRGPGTVDRVLRRGGDPDNGYAGKVLGRD